MTDDDGYNWGDDNAKLPGIMARATQTKAPRHWARRLWARLVLVATFGRREADDVFSTRQDP